MTTAKQNAVANANAELNNVTLPTYSEVINALRDVLASSARLCELQDKAKENDEIGLDEEDETELNALNIAGDIIRRASC